MAGVPLPGQELLLLPDPVDGVLNHVPLNDNPLPPQPNLVLEATKLSKSPSSLEDLCVRAYLKYLENEVVTYVSLTQSKSHLVKGVAKRMLQVRIKFNVIKTFPAFGFCFVILIIFCNDGGVLLLINNEMFARS